MENLPLASIWFACVLQATLILDPRTERLIGEPKISNPGIIALCLDTDMHVQTVSFSPIFSGNND